MYDAPDPQVHFGGPDKAPRLLRDLLRQRIDAVPAGGTIAWATYYFRDRDLAEALITAVNRGVKVLLQVEGSPRRRSANAPVLELLQNHGLGGGLAVHRPGPLHEHLHSKIYYFSHPHPSVLVGSFNPSGDVPEDPEIVAEIGDQDRGHNVLVEIGDTTFAEGLHHHIERLDRPFARLRNRQPLIGAQASAWFFPRWRVSIAEQAVAGAAEIVGCISHLKAGRLVNRLKDEARGGARIRLLVHDTNRRVPQETVTDLRKCGIEIRRFVHPDGLPMHAKFLIADGVAWFGSFNYNPRSSWLNSEILLSSRHSGIVGPLAARFEEICESSH